MSVTLPRIDKKSAGGSPSTPGLQKEENLMRSQTHICPYYKKGFHPLLDANLTPFLRFRDKLGNLNRHLTFLAIISTAG